MNNAGLFKKDNDVASIKILNYILWLSGHFWVIIVMHFSVEVYIIK